MKKGQLRQQLLSLGVGIAVFWFWPGPALEFPVVQRRASGIWALVSLTPRADPITYFAQRPDGGEMQALMEEAGGITKAIGRPPAALRTSGPMRTPWPSRRQGIASTAIFGSIRRRFRRPTASSSTIWTRWAGSWAVCELPGCRAGDFRGAGVSAEGAGHPAQAEGRVRGAAQSADGLGAV